MQTVAQRKRELAEAAEAERIAHEKAETVREARGASKAADPESAPDPTAE